MLYNGCFIDLSHALLPRALYMRPPWERVFVCCSHADDLQWFVVFSPSLSNSSSSMGQEVRTQAMEAIVATFAGSSGQLASGQYLGEH